MAKFRPEQLDVSTGTTDNDTVTTKGYVDDKVAPENTWDRVTGPANYLKPANAGDFVHLNEAENVSFFVTSDVQIFRNSSPDISMWAAATLSTTDANLNLTRSRGTIASPAAVQDNDLIGNINFVGASDASNFNNGAEIRGEINGAVSTGVLPCDMVFFVNAGAGAATEGMRLDKNKNLTVEGNIGVGNLSLTGNTITTSSGDLNLNSFSNDIFMQNVRPSTLQFPAGPQVNEISTTAGPLSTNSQLLGALEIYTEFAYLNGKTGGQTLSGGFGLGEDLDLQSTGAATKGEVRVRDGSDFVFDGGGTGLFKVEANADAKIALGRSMISSPTTDVAYWSHYDTGDSTTDYAIKQLTSGRTAINSATGVPLDLNINNVTQATITSGTLSVDKLEGKSSSTSVDIDKLTFDTSVSGFTTLSSSDSANVFILDGTTSSAIFRLDRAATNQNGNIEFHTATVQKWVAGLDSDATDDFHIKGGSAGDIKLAAGTSTGNIELTPGSSGAATVNGYINQEGIFAEIYVADASAQQLIPTGATYTKSTGFTTDGQSSNCTADATNDKITITQTGKYRVSGSCSALSGTANVLWRGAAFLNGVEQNQVHWKRKMTTTTDSGDMGFTGFIDVTSAPWDLDFRLRHDNGAGVNFTIEYANLNVEYIGAT